MQNILGLDLVRGRVVDRFERIIMRITLKAVNNFIPGRTDVEKTQEILERRIEMVRRVRDVAYGKALSFLIETNSVYEQYLPRKQRNSWSEKRSGLYFSKRKRKLIRLSLWMMMGNEIPENDFNENLVRRLLDEKGVIYVRKTGRMGWWFLGQFMGKNYFDVLRYLECLDLIDRKKLVNGLITHK